MGKDGDYRRWARRVGEGEFVQGRVDAEERVVRGERTAVGDGMRV